jgi:polar amino acid transport system ATP-binding protein
VRDNVALGPIKVKGIPAAVAQKQARDFLHRVGLESQIDKYPPQLSGGQQQRVAIARALAMEPPIILFDEPTSSLDPEMVGEVLSVMKNLAHTGITMICVTHEMGFASDVADRVWFMSDGQLIEDSPAAAFFKRPKHFRAQEFLQHLR